MSGAVEGGKGKTGADAAPRAYRYQSEQASLLLPVYRRVLWDRVLVRIPAAVTPNMLTVAGTIAAALSCGVVFVAVPGHPGALVFSAVLVLLYLTLDNLDGFHARRTGQSSALGEFLDHWLDTLNSGFLTVAVCHAVRMPTWMTLGMVTCANLSFFAIHWAHRRTGALRLGRLADIEGGTLVAAILVASAFSDPREWAPLVFVLAAGTAVQTAWTVGESLGRVRVSRRDWLPILVSSAALLAWHAGSGPGAWPIILLAALLNVLCTGRAIADRVRPSPGPRFDIAAAIALVVASAAMLALEARPQVSAAAAWTLAGGFVVAAVWTLASDLRALARRPPLVVAPARQRPLSS